MGRKAKIHNMVVTRGSTWTDTFYYLDEDTGAPILLTGYKARMQIRTFAGRQGISTTETLVMELDDAQGLTVTAVEGKVSLLVSAIDTVLLSPANKRARLAYSIELYADGVSPEIVIPFITGRIRVLPEITR